MRYIHEMIVDGLLIPAQLESLLEAERWPRTSAEAQQQNSESRIPKDRNRRLRRIYLYAPPFHTIARSLDGSGKDFYSTHGAVHELVPDRTIAIGDFGLGADTTILLDYSVNATKPRVLELEWPGEGRPNYWVVMAPDFATFVEMLGL